MSTFNFVPPVSTPQLVLGHVGLKLTPLALDKPVGQNHQELAAPVDAVHDILCHRDADLEVPLVYADSQFGILLLQLGYELLGDPVVLLLTVGDEHVVQVRHLLLLKVLVLPSLLHQPERNEKPSPVGDDEENYEYNAHSCDSNSESLRHNVE